MRLAFLIAVMLAMASLPLSNTVQRRSRREIRRRSAAIVKRATLEGDDFQEMMAALQETVELEREVEKGVAELEREVKEVEEEAALDLVMEEMEQLVEKKVESLKEEDEMMEGVKIDLDEFQLGKSEMYDE